METGAKIHYRIITRCYYCSAPKPTQPHQMSPSTQESLSTMHSHPLFFLSNTRYSILTRWSIIAMVNTNCFWVDAVDVKSLGLLYEEMTSCGEDRLICGAGWRKAAGRLYPYFVAGQILLVGTSGCVELRFFQCYNLAKVITASLNKHWGSTRSLDESLTDHADDLPVSKSRRSGVMGRTFPELQLNDLSKFKCGTCQQ